MPPLLLIYKDANGVKNIPLSTVEAVADYLMVHGLEGTFWENVAGDRAGDVLRLQMQLKTLRAEYEELAEYVGHPVKEASK